MNKQLVVEQIIAHLDAELLRYAKAARVAHSEATDEQSRAENKYDTRGLEASYLAHGQSRQVIETEQAREQYAAMSLRTFDTDEPIAMSALVELETEVERVWYFLAQRLAVRKWSVKPTRCSSSRPSRRLVAYCWANVVTTGLKWVQARHARSIAWFRWSDRLLSSATNAARAELGETFSPLILGRFGRPFASPYGKTSEDRPAKTTCPRSSDASDACL